MKFLKVLRSKINNPSRVTDVKLKILIPLYQEQKILPTLISRFVELTSTCEFVEVILITTEKEVSIDGQPTTFQLATSLLSTNHSKFSIHHYPEKFGVMAHQLNFSINSLLDSEEDSTKTFIAVYNADSVPSLNTLNAFQNILSQNPTSKVFQQVAIFTQNYSEYSGLSSLLMKASAIIQTRWSLGFETKMLERQSKFWKQHENKKLNIFEKLIEPISYCVGHGLFIRLDTISKIGGFPTETLNEDLPLGYYLGLACVPINLLPVIESADNPKNVISLINQKRSWFWGMVDYLEYSKFAGSKVPEVDKLRVRLATIKGLFRDAFAWLGMGICILFIITFTICNFNLYLLSVLLITFTIYAFVPAGLIIKNLQFLHDITDKNKIRLNYSDYILVLLFTIPYLIISSIGPWMSFFNLISNKLWKSKLYKPKTEH